MEENYNWTRDGEIVQKVINKTWVPFAEKYGMKVEFSSVESGKLKKMEIKKNDLIIKVFMSRTLPFECIYYSANGSCLSGGLHRIYEAFIPKEKNIVWFFNHKGLGVANNKNKSKEENWIHGMNNQIFLLEKYCSELLETGDICGWLAKYQPNT